MCKFETKEACESRCFSHQIWAHGAAKASGVRRCGAAPARSRRGAGAVLCGMVAAAFLWSFCVRSYIGGSKAWLLFTMYCWCRRTLGSVKRLQFLWQVGQCASLKVRKRANPCVFTINLSAQVAKASSGVRRCVQRGRGAVSARSWHRAAWHAGQFFCQICVHMYIGGSKARLFFTMQCWCKCHAVQMRWRRTCR